MNMPTPSDRTDAGQSVLRRLWNRMKRTGPIPKLEAGEDGRMHWTDQEWADGMIQGPAGYEGPVAKKIGSAARKVARNKGPHAWPMSLAPRDGTQVLAWSGDFREWIIVAWDEKKQDWCETWEGEGDLVCYCWMSLPPDLLATDWGDDLEAQKNSDPHPSTPEELAMRIEALNDKLDRKYHR